LHKFVHLALQIAIATKEVDYNAAIDVDKVAIANINVGMVASACSPVVVVVSFYYIDDVGYAIVLLLFLDHF
jgi:hypothetical protein